MTVACHGPTTALAYLHLASQSADHRDADWAPLQPVALQKLYSVSNWIIYDLGACLPGFFNYL